jgi:hypothetical protein
MISPALEQFVDRTAADLRAAHPDCSLSDFSLKTLILDQARQFGSNRADELTAVHLLAAQLEGLKALSLHLR